MCLPERTDYSLSLYIFINFIIICFQELIKPGRTKENNKKNVCRMPHVNTSPVTTLALLIDSAHYNVHVSYI